MVKSWLVQDQTVLGKDYSNLLIADSLLKTIWFINAPCYGNEALASPKANVSAVGDIVSTASAATTVSAATTTNATIKTVDDITLAQALKEMKNKKPKKNGDDIRAKINAYHELAERMQAQEQEDLSIKEKATLFQQLLEKRRKLFAAKRAEEKRNKPPTKYQQRKTMCTYLKNMKGYKLKDLKLKKFDSIQEMFDRAFKRVNTFEDFRTKLAEGKEKRAEIELIQEITKLQKVEDDKETAELK
ncbi:hypothetical protein Tco_1174408 [Tanacetum coccineum]